MRRRQFIAVVGGAAAWPLAVLGQQPPSLLRVGASSVQPRTTAIFVAFVERMAELGYEEGKSAPRRRVSPMEEGSIQTVVDGSGS
jgi:hypothetical protein